MIIGYKDTQDLSFMQELFEITCYSFGNLMIFL